MSDEFGEESLPYFFAQDQLEPVQPKGGKLQTGPPKADITINLVKVYVEKHEYFLYGAHAPKGQSYTPLPASAAPRKGRATADDDDMRKWREQVQHFERMRESLCQDDTLRNQFVAVWHGQVVDHDADKFMLARRTLRNYPDDVVLIKRVQRHDPVVEMPSPESD